MRKIYILMSIAVTTVLFMNSKIYGQDSVDKLKLNMFGLGLHIEQFKLTDITMDIMTAPANKIIFTITPIDNFRVEPEIGFNYINDKESEHIVKSIHIGIGSFGMYQRGKTNIYGGLRFEYANISNEYNDWYTDDKETEKINKISIGPAIGAEFFLGQHFSFGGEIGLKYMNFNTKYSKYNNDKTVKQDYITTDSGLLLRFYF